MFVRKLFLILFALAFIGGGRSLHAQNPPEADVSAIEDNSFLIEEAFNQEKNVIQHINTFTRTWNDQGWMFTYTEEWPLPGHERHQLSVTVPALESTDNPGSGGGFGDVFLNYRYQVCGGGGKRFSFSPRLSLLLPTGSVRHGRGSGGVGLQTNLPISVYINRKFITHWNAGATVVPSARNAFGDRAAVNGYNLGQSMIWLVHPRFNFMLETIWAGSQTVVGPSQTQRNHDLLIGPGIRWAHNFKNGLQIVPGISVPMGVGPSAGERGISFYLSFEHPIGATGPK
jgi:hypothetical protein